MTRPGLVFPLAIAALVTATLIAQAPPMLRAASSDHDRYTGSAACRRCHEEQYVSWKRTLHVQMTKPIGEARLVGDFRAGTHPQQHGRSYTMETRDGRYFISISKGGEAAERFEIHYTLGARRFQGYLSRLPDGRIYVLPVFWHNESRRWIDFKEITPIPDDPSHDLRQIWNITCVNCHATNLVKNYNVATGTYSTTWTEMGIGCEACHGPGQAHIHDPKYLSIFSIRRATPRQVFDMCGYCHGNKNNVFFGFTPGDRYEDYALPFLISQPIPDNDPQGDFWPDGRPSRFNRPQALTLTGCFQKGEATCTSCHRMHGEPNDHALKVPVEQADGAHTRQSDFLCTQCHRVDSDGTGRAMSGARPLGDLSAHTHHAAASPGSRCIECHMSDVNWRLFTRRRDHTFQPPVPELSARYGVPNACTTCHEDKSPEWAASMLDRWYGNRERRLAVSAMADTIYRAGAGDTSVMPEVARLAVTRSHGALIRASAAEFAGQLLARRTDSSGPPDAAIVNALVGAANDPEPMVRIKAVQSLGLVSQARVIPVLAARLVDAARVVRVRAAEALLSLGVASLDGPVGRALANAQDEWAASLRTFNDAAADQTALGQLEAARGRSDEAVQALNAAIKLDPSDARPHVHLGILAARVGRYGEAVREFKTAKSLAPTYPNVDRLIEEAQKRR